MLGAGVHQDVTSISPQVHAGSPVGGLQNTESIFFSRLKKKKKAKLCKEGREFEAKNAKRCCVF